MSSSTTGPPVTRRPARTMALVAVLLVVIGSFLPWVHTPIGNVSGGRGAGLWTAYAAFVGLAGTLMPWHRVGAGHLAVFAVVALALPAWQLLHLVNLVGFGGWMPGTGLVLVAVGGVLAATAALRTWRQV
ncbi:hypothetical protein ACHAAC_11130 [Aeromicrobium sp. CF4.19]|uniref:hypothetical protein n=1 Tax=Aeromicrobium sp. CF4.19 TaxID=3373082 RepID=UPI003EE7C1CD